MAKRNRKRNSENRAIKARPSAGADDDTAITALALPPAPLSAGMAAYFAKCEEKLGFVPNVLKAYAFDTAKLSAFVPMYNDLMLAPSGLSKLEREMIAVAVSPRIGAITASSPTARPCVSFPAILCSAN